MLIIETPRLVLKEFQDRDIDPLYTIFSDAETMKYYPSPFLYEKTVDWVRRNQDRYQEHGFGLWDVYLKETKQCIGDCGLVGQIVDGKAEVEVGYHINKVYWSNGYATEAAQACSQYGFNQLRLTRLISIINPDNQPSIRVAEKNGFQKEEASHIFGREHVIYSKTIMENVSYETFL